MTDLVAILEYVRSRSREAQRRIVAEGASAEDTLISLRHIENVITEALDA